MSYLVALEQALDTWRKKGNLDRQAQYDAVIALAEWGVFSNRHISEFTGVRPSTVSSLTKKSDKSGGRLEPEAIPFITGLITGERTPETIQAALDAGVSTTMLARLTGISQSYISRRTQYLRDAA